MSEQGRCRSCNAAILWVETESGRRMPLDPEPMEDGSIIIHMGPNHQQKASEIAHIETAEEAAARSKATEPAARTAYVSHFVTCPDAARWRRRRPGPFSAAEKEEPT